MNSAGMGKFRGEEAVVSPGLGSTGHGNLTARVGIGVLACGIISHPAAGIIIRSPDTLSACHTNTNQLIYSFCPEILIIHY